MFSQLPVSASLLLWVGGSLIALFLLLGSMSRRRVGLTGVLRGFVDKKQARMRENAARASGENEPSLLDQFASTPSESAGSPEESPENE